MTFISSKGGNFTQMALMGKKLQVSPGNLDCLCTHPIHQLIYCIRTVHLIVLIGSFNITSSLVWYISNLVYNWNLKIQGEIFVPQFIGKSSLLKYRPITGLLGPNSQAKPQQMPPCPPRAHDWWIQYTYFKISNHSISRSTFSLSKYHDCIRIYSI